MSSLAEMGRWARFLCHVPVCSIARRVAHGGQRRLGPDDVIGHAHADFLALEFSLDGKRMITGPGVFSYNPRHRRDLMRSAASHDGPGYEGLEPAEFFDAWRVGWHGAAHQLEGGLLPGTRRHEVADWCGDYDRFGGHTLPYVCLSDGGKGDRHAK